VVGEFPVDEFPVGVVEAMNALSALGVPSIHTTREACRALTHAGQPTRHDLVALAQRLRRDGHSHGNEVTSDVSPRPKPVDDPSRRHHQLYRLTDASGSLLYVGISYSAIARMAQHKADKAWWSDVANIAITDLGEITRRKAEEMERDAIKRERPLHNIKHNDGAVAPAPLGPTRSRCSIVGWFALTRDDDPMFPSHQGQFVDDLGDGLLLVQWFSWLSGEPTNCSVVPIRDTTTWSLYTTEAAWHKAGNAAMRRRDRENGARHVGTNPGGGWGDL
jgi:predicted GIY-YIG superfamily endonuclease